MSIDSQTSSNAQAAANSANDAIQAAIEQWYQANQQYYSDYGQLQEMIATMMNLLSHGNAQEAYQVAQNGVLPQSMQTQGDTMGQLAAANNINSAMRSLITQAQNAFNNLVSGGAQDITAESVMAFITPLQTLYNQISGPNTPPWIDPSSAASLTSAMQQFSQQFGLSDPNAMANGAGPSIVMEALTNWVNNPNSTTNNSNGQTGQQNIQTALANFNTGNNTVSALNQEVNAELQFGTQEFSQYEAAVNQVFQNTNAFITQLVKNEISS